VEKTLLVVAGPNGSGKSTVMNMIRKDPNFQRYIYISPDEVVKDTRYSGITDEEERYKAAMTDCERARNVLITLGEPVAFETVFSSGEKLDFIIMARNAGYDINVIYISTENPDINVLRVAQRVDEGGHDVPVEKIYSRYLRSMNYLYPIFEIAQYISVYDNSEDKPVALFYKDKGYCYHLNQEKKKPWLNEFLTDRVSEQVQAEHSWHELGREQTIVFVDKPNSRRIGLMNL
jgi:predicted ABC-type ATPase